MPGKLSKGISPHFENCQNFKKTKNYPDCVEFKCELKAGCIMKISILFYQRSIYL